MKNNENNEKELKISKLKLTRNIFLLTGSISPLASISGVMLTPSDFRIDVFIILLGVYISSFSFLNAHNINEDIKQYKKRKE